MYVALQQRHMSDTASQILSNILSRLTTKEISKCQLLALCEDNPPVTGGSPHKRPVLQKVFPHYDTMYYTLLKSILEVKKLNVLSNPL